MTKQMLEHSNKLISEMKHDQEINIRTINELNAII